MDDKGLKGFVDLTLKCPVCGRRADMCFAHGDDWKKRREMLALVDGELVLIEAPVDP